MQRYVHDVLNDKGSEVWTVASATTVYDALAVMADKNVGALVVVDDGKIVGIVSERDYARRLALEGKRSRKTPVSEIMTRVVASVSSGNSMKECMSLMTSNRVRHLPVIDNDELIGLVSIGDVVKALVMTQEQTIQQLEAYITGKV